MSEQKPHPAGSPVTWLLAVVFLCGIDAAVTRTSILWGPTAFENSGGVRSVFPQTYQVARKIYAPERDAPVRVALLGNSRIALAIKEKRLERALRAAAPELDAKVSNLGIFGAFMGDTEVLARHLGRLDPSVVVLAIGAADLIRKPTHPDGHGPMQLLRIGWRDGPLPVARFTERLDRWVRTAWRLYRFREFAREAILDRVLGRPDPGAPPEEFESRIALFRHLYSGRADEVHAAWQTWERDRTLASYTRYLETASPGHLARGRQRARAKDPLTRETPSAAVLDMLIGRLVAERRPTVVLLMPENPILALDTAGEFHRPGLADRAAALIREIAADHGVPVIDARRWLPPECFLDFDHPIIDLDEFEGPLAQEIANVVQS